MTKSVFIPLFIIVLFVAGSIIHIPRAYSDTPTITIKYPLHGSLINKSTFTVTGTAAHSKGPSISLVEVKVDSGSFKPATGTTSWSFVISSLSNGPHTITAKVSAGSHGSSTTAVKITIDTIAPAAPKITSPASGTTTTDTTPTFSGTAEASSTVRLYDGTNTTPKATTTASTTGTWSATSTALSGGTHSMTIKATDKAGNTSPSSSAVSVTISTTTTSTTSDTSPPSGSVSINSGASHTKSTSATLSLSCYDSGSGCYQMRISVDGTLDSETFQTYYTSKSVTLPSGDGTKTVKVQFKDKAGNVSPQYSDTIILDTKAPAAPKITSPATGTTTTDTTPTFSGTAEASSTVRLYDGTNTTPKATTTASTTGTWSATPSTALSGGTHSMTIKATDKAGNTSPSSSAVSVTISTTTTSTFNGISLNVIQWSKIIGADVRITAILTQNGVTVNQAGVNLNLNIDGINKSVDMVTDSTGHAFYYIPDNSVLGIGTHTVFAYVDSNPSIKSATGQIIVMGFQ